MFPDWIKLSRVCGVIAGIALVASSVIQYPPVPFWFKHVIVIIAIPFFIPWERLPIQISRILSMVHLLPLSFLAFFCVSMPWAILHHEISASPGTWFFTSFLWIFCLLGTGYHWFVVHQIIKIVQQTGSGNHPPSVGSA
jgi:hypothetical protein